jgi:rhodanese-related sulfurtransferase
MMIGLMVGGALVLVLAVALLRAGGAAGYEKLALSVAQMQAMGGVIVDIRSASEWKDTGVIAGAKLVTFKDAEGFLKAVGKDLAEGQPLILICRSGARSSAAAAALAGKIPNRIISAKGGMSAVLAEGYAPLRPSK